MQFLYKIQPTRSTMLADGPTAEEHTVIAQHSAYLQQLTQQSVLLLAGRTLNTDARAVQDALLHWSFRQANTG